jgi:hypothetical protein
MQPNDLDQALDALPRDLPPDRDLWPGIRAQLAPPARRSGLPLWAQLAAGVVLVLSSSAITYFVAAQKPARVAAMPVDNTVADYLQARAELERIFAERIAALPASTRAKLQNELATLRQAADSIAATLAQYPDDSLLQDMLQSTRQRELQLLADIGRLDIPNS